MMPKEGYVHENILIECDDPAAALSAVGPEKNYIRWKTVLSPVLPRQHGPLSVAITDEIQRSVTFLTIAIYFILLVTSSPTQHLQPSYPRLLSFSAPANRHPSSSARSPRSPPHDSPYLMLLAHIHRHGGNRVVELRKL